MKATEFYFFSYPVEGRKKPATTTYRMTIEQAAERLPPGHEPILSSREVRQCPETMDERYAMGGGALYVPFKSQ